MGAQGCEVCDEVTPQLEAAALKYDGVMVARIPAEKAQKALVDTLCRRANASCVPLTVAIANGEKVGVNVGIISSDVDYCALIERGEMKIEIRSRKKPVDETAALDGADKWWADEQRFLSGMEEK